MSNIDITRRKMFKLAGALAMIPVFVAPASSQAAQNPAMRNALKYQDTPSAGKKCVDCLHFVPGAKADGPGGCRMFAGDTEISPNGYCTAWAQKK